MRPSLMVGVCLLLAVPLRVAAGESARLAVVNSMILRPQDPWPRGKGHVVLGVPGSGEDFKGYHEPGGNFSPAFGSFGLSLWVLDGEGDRLTTSDTLPLEKVEQSYYWPAQRIWPRRPEVPGIRTVTPHYETEWSVLGENRWQLRVGPRGTNTLALVLRSVGPAGGALKSLHWFPDNRLFVNDRWVVSFSFRPQGVEIVAPGGAATLNDVRGEPTWGEEAVWGYAKFTLLAQQEHWVTIEDAVIPPVNPFEYSALRPLLTVQVPDQQFTDCLEAQVANLMMGLVGVETRPGDPNSYPLNWLRDGAYIIVALARAGQLDAAAQLSGPFAEHDFFGGFGAEADGPGLALWALTEVAGMRREARFDEWLWPHARRKAGLVMEMLTATNALRRPYVGPVVPRYAGREDLDLVCDAARDGLIMGRMDWHRPVLYVNAVSYRGLLNAAELAARLGQAREAEQWRARALELRGAWMKGLMALEANERTTICGLYPSWIVTDREVYGAKLAERRRKTHGEDGQLRDKPLWPYFSLAEAHQWLVLGGAEHAWNDLRWFWANQASPGLYTWWEGDGEENSFGRWEQVRGWVTPAHVTPHYWAAAEMLLLQLDMLACLDESGVEPVLRVGLGLPEAWLEQPMSVKGLPTRLGKVDWEWANQRMTVRARGFKGPVELGPVFPPDTALRVRR
ncbi:MAG: hypothetical protein KJ072_28005 [Verrucomicrobia bacterium]|nr:hypothetical protein [Verrucomicrobiota bacterium]